MSARKGKENKNKMKRKKEKDSIKNRRRRRSSIYLGGSAVVRWQAMRMFEDVIVRELWRHKRGGRGRIRLVIVLSAESLHNCQRLQRKRLNVNSGTIYASEKRGERELIPEPSCFCAGEYGQDGDE